MSPDSTLEMDKRGVFIVFEGIDGSGKSTHIKILADELRRRGHNVLQTSEPSKDRIGNFIRRYAERNDRRLTPETEALLFAADRFEHVKKVLKPALRRGRTVISDRYIYSTLAYQGAGGVSLDWIREMNRFAPKPDLAILLDILPEFGLQRVERKKTVFEVSDYLRKVREIYLRLVEQGELKRIDADKPKTLVQGEVLALVEELLEKRTGKTGS
ncbi:MAG: dTMP kinase [Candidatus Bathyarchaeota archaeon]|nr:MAG: dTMP kinase [Candidatus Bathyarchaeota archaeon]